MKKTYSPEELLEWFYKNDPQDYFLPLAYMRIEYADACNGNGWGIFEQEVVEILPDSHIIVEMTVPPEPGTHTVPETRARRVHWEEIDWNAFKIIDTTPKKYEKDILA